MRKTKRPKPLYCRDDFRLYAPRQGRTNFEIVWYDPAIGRERSVSAGTASLQRASVALDNKYLEIIKGRQCCPSCKRPYDSEKRMLVLEAIEVYLASATEKVSCEAIEYRLKHVVAYIATLPSPSILCSEVDETWIGKFRAWSENFPVANSKDGRQRALSTIENSVIQLAAAFRHVKEEPRFKPLQPKDLNRTPRFRAKVTHLVAMFRYCLHPEGPTVRSEKERSRRVRERQHILAFLRVSVLTLARPDAAHDISTDPSRGQWNSEQGILDLNPRGRRQTKKYRPIVPIARQGRPLFDETKGFSVKTGSARKGFYTMAQELGLPGDRESGMKLIRRSMADLIRARLVAAGRSEDELSMFLGHRKINSVSELYAPFNPGYLNNVRAVIEGIADEIEAGCQGAFSPQKHRTD